MTPAETEAGPKTSVEEIQKAWPDISSRIVQLESDRNILEQENKTLRSLLERVIEHRQKSHGELVLLLTTLVSKLPIGDVGFMVSKLVEHNNQVSEICATLSNSKVGAELPKPAALKAYEQTKRDLAAALKPAVDELLQLETPLPADMLQSLVTQPKLFYSPAVVRHIRCFLKKQVPRTRIVQEFGEAALVYFNDLTTDAKLNPRPKPDEIALAFKPDTEALLQQDSTLAPDKRQQLLGLFQKIQRSKAATEQAVAQKNAFLKLSFLIELLNYYENQGTESPDVIFAQRMPTLIEQLVVANERDHLTEKAIQPAETLLAYIINNDHRQSVINNIGKAGSVWRTLRFVLLFRSEKISEPAQASIDFVKHLLPTTQAPKPETLAAVLKLIRHEHQPLILRTVIASDRLKRAEAETLSRAVAKELGIKEEAVLKPVSVATETPGATGWEQIHELIANRADPAVVTAAVRTRLHAKYDSDEVKQSWTILTATDPMSLVRTFCQLPYLPDGSTDPVARAVMESYASRLMHEKYADIYAKIVKNLTNLFKVKPDSPTLVNFLNLLKWVDAEAEKKMAADIGIHVPA
jgi:hypothetical protein